MSILDKSTRILVLVGLVVLGLGNVARAEPELQWSGRIQSDTRFRVSDKTTGGWYAEQPLPVGLERNQNLFNLKLAATNERLRGVADLNLCWKGYSENFSSVGELSQPDKVAPYYLEARALYLEVTDFLVEKLDLRAGQQLVMWGKGDQFNPTNTINPNRLEDVLLFGEQQANNMVRLDYALPRDWSISGVLVPIFKPALVPDTAILGTSNVARLPFVSSQLRHRLNTEKTFTGLFLNYPTVVTSAIPELPERSAANMQGALRLAGTLGEHDFALSYYAGRSDMPQPYANYSRKIDEHRCPPGGASADCIDGTLQTQIILGYPRMQVLGLNLAGNLPLLSWLSKRIQPLGYRLEAGLFVPQQTNIVMMQERMDFGLAAQPAGEYDYYAGYQAGDPRPTVIESTPFAKWTVGLDYTFSRHIYLNSQWVHGFVDEFGAGDFFHPGESMLEGGVTSDGMNTLTCVLEKNGEKCSRELLRPRLGDYLVLGADFKFFEEKLLLRLFTIWALNGLVEEKWDEAAQKRQRRSYSMFTSEGFTAVVYPEVNYNFGGGWELGAGALFQLGRDYSKFGAPENGGSLVWGRARYSY